jgi:hypothetical protein
VDPVLLADVAELVGSHQGAAAGPGPPGLLHREYFQLSSDWRLTHFVTTQASVYVDPDQFKTFAKKNIKFGRFYPSVLKRAYNLFISRLRIT